MVTSSSATIAAWPALMLNRTEAVWLITAAFVWSMSLAGGIFFLLGLVGFIWGRPGTSSWADRPPNEKLLVLLPSWLELGWNDHVLNLLFGIGFFVAVVAALAETPPRLRK